MSKMTTQNFHNYSINNETLLSSILCIIDANKSSIMFMALVKKSNLKLSTGVISFLSDYPI